MTARYPLQALTLQRPWPWAITVAGKLVENRQWRPPRALVGNYLAIHAGKEIDRSGREGLEQILQQPGPWMEVPPAESMTEGAIVAVAKVARVVTVAELMGPHPGNCSTVWWTDAQRRWACGPYCWLLSELRVLPEPVACKGAQRLWTVPEDVTKAVRIQWAKAVINATAARSKGAEFPL